MKNILLLLVFSAIFNVLAVSGDNCSTAILVSSSGCSTPGQFNNTGITGTLTSASCFSTGNNNGMWFSFLASGPVVQITVNASSLSVAQIALLSNASGCTGTFTELSCIKGTAATTTLDYSNLTAGTTYYVYIDGVNDNVGTFQLCLTSPSQPTNDQVCNAITLQTNNFCSPSGGYTNYGATTETLMGALPSCITATDQINSVYFKFVATGSSNTITVNGSSTSLVRPQFILFTLSSCSATSYVSNGCVAATATSNTATLTINNLIPGTTYYVMVDGYDSGTGAFQICVNSYTPTGTVQNDDCSSSTILCPGNRYYSTTKGATPNANIDPLADGASGEWNCNGVVDNSVWFTFTTTSPAKDVVFTLNSTCVDLGAGSYPDGGKLQFEVFERADGKSNCANRNSNTLTGTWNSVGCTSQGQPSPAVGSLTIPAASLQPNKQYFLVVDNYPDCGCDFDFVINGNAGTDAGADQSVCLNATSITMSGNTPTGGVWSGPGINSSGVFNPATAGLGSHVVYYTAGNCTDSKIITVTGPIVTVSNDVTVCSGQAVNLTGNIVSPSTVVKNFSATPGLSIPDGGVTSTWNGSTGTFASSTLAVSGLNTGWTLNSITLNITHDWDGDVIAYLKSPCGGTLKLLNLNGSLGNDFTNTVFNQSATTAIASGTAPFTGTFIPAGGAAAFNTFITNCAAGANGTWTLVVGDAYSSSVGTLQNWAMNFTTPVSPTTYAWSPTTNMTNSTTLTPTVAPTSTTTYTLTATDYQGCIGVDNVVVTITSGNVPTFTAIGPLCQNSTAPTLPTSSTNTPPITGTWNSSISTATSGTTTYTFTPSAGQCASVVTMSVQVTNQITPTFTQIGPLCQNSTAPSLPISSTNTPSISGSWNSTISTTTLGQTTYTFTPNPNQCAINATMDVMISTPQNPTFTQLGPYCQNATPGVLPTSSTNSPVITGTWNTSISTAIVGTQTYTFTPTSGVCANNATMSIVINQPITPTFNSVGPYCQNSAVPSLPTSSTNSPAISGTWNTSISTLTPGSITYTFTPSAGQCAINTTLQVQITAQIVPLFTQLGAYCKNDIAGTLPTTSNNGVNGSWDKIISTAVPGTQTYTFTPTVGQCASNATMSVIVTSPTIPTFNSVGTLCLNATAPSLPTSSTNSPSISGTWDNQISTASIGTQLYTFTPVTGQCATQATLSVIIANPIVPTFTQLGPYCQNATPGVLPTSSTNIPAITGTWNTSISTATIGSSIYTFTPSNGQCASTQQMTIVVTAPITPQFNSVSTVCKGSVLAPLSTTSLNAITGTWSPSLDNSQTKTYTFTPSNGQCAVPAQLTININQPIQPDFTQIAPICAYQTLSPLPSSSNNGIAGVWTPIINNTKTTTYTFTPSSGQCATTSSMVITIYPKPTAAFVPSPNEISQSNPTSYLINTTKQADTYYWDFGDGTTSTEKAPHHLFNVQDSNDIVVKLVATSIYGCVDSTTRVISIKELLIFYIPNSFTPDQDQFNQIFKPVFTTGYDQYAYKLSIFDRWGELVFESKDVNVGWDGTYGGKIVQDGVYIWKVEYVEKNSADKKTIQGHVTLLR